jgi:AsmA-like C-terminal region
VDAMIALKSLAVGEQKLTEVEGRLVKRPDSPIINISNFFGRVHEGVISGNVDIRTGEEITYGVRLDVSRVQLAELFRTSATQPAAPPDKAKPGESTDVTGLLEGRLEMVATVGKPERTKASGEIRITKAHMFKLPVMLELLHVVYLTPPGGGAFNDGRMSYQLKGNQLIFTEISLRGNALSVLGSGTVEMDTKKMNMAFISGPPPQAGLIRLDEAGPILRGIVRELMEVQVTGTLDRPVMRPVPWTSLDAIMQKLMNPEKEK